MQGGQCESETGFHIKSVIFENKSGPKYCMLLFSAHYGRMYRHFEGDGFLQTLWGNLQQIGYCTNLLSAHHIS